MTDKGIVHLTGAGPGDPDLLTVRARSLIENCDVLVYDYLTDPRLRGLTRPDCQLFDVGKRPRQHAMAQNEIEDLLAEHAKAGKTVVRLKGGDPFIFGRGGEEAARLKALGIACEAIPGVTAALGAASTMGIPLTHREFASSVTFVTGHERPDKADSLNVDFKQLGGLPGTLCIYMGMGQLDKITADLMAGGRAPDTPAAVIQWATLANQKSLLCQLRDLPERTRQAGLEAPAVVIVGKVAGLRDNLAWFEQRPLFGRRVAITRSRAQSGNLNRGLQALGAEVLELPLLHIREHKASARDDHVLHELGTYEWILFTSPNGVQYFFRKFLRKFNDIRCFGGMKIACIGQATARELERFHLSVDLIPDTATAEGLADALLATQSLDNLAVLMITGNRNRDALRQKLEKNRAIVDSLQVYTTEFTDLADLTEAERFRREGADAITFTSASTVEHFTSQAESLGLMPGARQPKAFSIGPLTTAKMAEKGIPLAAESKHQSIDSLIQTIVEQLAKQPH